ncbi:MAG: HAD family phosphatase [Saprospiraceae bacterium]|nr:HAD family phosphatase [Saprospiraceae bacterium]
MNNGVIDTVVFDLGGVLIDWNPEYLYRKIFREEAEMRHFLSEVCTPHWNAEQDAGRLLEEATQLLVGQFPAYEVEIRAYYERWTEMLGGALTETVQILEQLHRQGSHRLLALTNWSHETFPYAYSNFRFLHLFEGILVSGEEKLKKPDPVIYRLLIERYGIEPARALFIDDNAENVESARNVGLQAVQFTSAGQLREELKSAGIF